MPPSKNAWIRYRILDQCLRDHQHRWSKKDLTERVNRHLESRYGPEKKVTESAIRHDLDDIEIHFEMRLDRYPEGNPRYYRYENPDDSLFNIPLSPEDIARMTRAMELLSSIKGFELAEEIHPIVTSLQNRTLLKEESNKKVLQFDHQPTADGAELIQDFLVSIQQATALKVAYQPFSEKEPVVHNFHPYVLKEYNSRWFCLGYCSHCKQVMNLGLDRVAGPLKVLKEPYIQNTFFDPVTYFKDIIGVTRPAGVEKQAILFEVSEERFPYFKSKPLHESQIIIQVQPDGRAVLQLEVIPNKELIAAFLSFGKDLKVLQPQSVVEAIKEVVGKMVVMY